MSEIIVYLDSYRSDGKNSYETIILDFRTRADYELYAKSLNVKETPGTFIQINGYHSPKRLIPGSYYALNIDMMKQVQPIKNQESLLIGYSYDFQNYTGPNDASFHLLGSHGPLNPTELYSSHHRAISTLNLQVQTDNAELHVHNVGQANWNEIRQDDNVKMVYDIGAPMNASKVVVRQYVNQFSKQYQQDQPDLVLSHWDIDHYYCLLEMSDQELSSFSRFICVDMMKSNMPKQLFDRIERVLGKDKIFCYIPDARMPGTTFPLMNEKYSNAVLSIYAGESSRNKNYSGLVLTVRGNKSHALMTGDCLLIQADYVLQHFHIQQNSKGWPLQGNGHYLVVPHHGGNIKASFRAYHIPTGINPIEAIISVDENNALNKKQYKHPSKEMVNYLKGIFGSSIVRTDKAGMATIVRPL